MSDIDLEKMRADMRLYRLGVAPLPEQYIVMHEWAARLDVSRLLDSMNRRLIEMRLVKDGCLDGMRVLRVICEDMDTMQLHDVRWSDANGGSWFEHMSGSRQLLIEKSPRAPGFF